MAADWMLNVLISSAGRRVALLQAFRHDLCQLNVGGRILTADASALSAAAQFADLAFLVPRCTSQEFVPTMVDLCRQHDVGLVIPTIDTELAAYAEARDAFAAVGTQVAISSPGAVQIASDKVLTHRWLTESGLPTVRQATLDEVRAAPSAWPFPFIVKPRRGSAAIGVAVVNSDAQLEVAAEQADLVVQSLAAGREYTVDALIDKKGKATCAVARLRLEVRAGEVSKAVTTQCEPVLEAARLACLRLPGAYGPITLQIFYDERTGAVSIIELNARFGGGYPLSWRAGARYPQWMMEELLGRPVTTTHTWEEGLVMLRYDDAAYVDAATVGL